MVTKIEWTDATSYSQGQRGRVSPNSWECRIGDIRIWISTGHIYYPSQWVIRCPAMGLDLVAITNINAANVSAAKRAALLSVCREAGKRIATYQRLIEIIEVDHDDND